MRLKVQNSIGVNTMKVKLMKAKLKHVCNQKEFIWGVRVSGLILGIGRKIKKYEHCQTDIAAYDSLF